MSGDLSINQKKALAGQIAAKLDAKRASAAKAVLEKDAEVMSRL